MFNPLLKIATLTLALNFAHSGSAQIGIYMSELIGKTYKRVIDSKTGEYRIYEFTDVDGDGWASGVQRQFFPNPEDPTHMIPVYDYILSFEIKEKDECGNCMIFAFEDDSKRYFTIHHDGGDFWIQESDATFDKWDETQIFLPFTTPTSASAGEGLNEITAVASSTERYYDWGEAPEEGGWVVPYAAGSSFTGESVTSVLPEDENFDYVMENAFDDNPYTTWFSDPETNAEYPVDESITFTGMVYNETIWILNGIQYSTEDFENNSRVKTMTVYVNGTYFATVTLLDQMGAQQISLEGINEYQTGGNPVTIEFRIIDVYPGAVYPEAGIAEIYTVGG